MTDPWILLTGGRVIDGLGNDAVDNHDVLIGDGRILAVEPTIDVDRVPRHLVDSLIRIDARSKTVMPGMIDAHCHMTYGESRTEEEIDIYTSVERRTLIAAANLRKVLAAGVTSISQPGGSWYVGVALRESIDSGLIVGPRMKSAGRYLTTSNGLTDWFPDSTGVPDGSIGQLTNTAPEMVDAIRHQVKNGVDLIKVADSPFGEFQAFADDELKLIADTAHRLGVQTTIHARGDSEVRAAVAAQFDWIMHGNVMNDDTIEQLAESRIPLVPTLLLLANLADFADIARVPTSQSDGCIRMLEKTAVSLHKARDAGVRFVVGTDTGFAIAPYGEWHWRELELLTVYAGLTTLEAIESATSAAAHVMGLEGELGIVAPGKLADLIVVNGNPAADIRVLQDRRNIENVILDGRLVTFDPVDIERRWHHDRANVYSHGDLTYDLVRNGVVTPPPPTPWTLDDGHDLVRAVENRGDRAVTEPDRSPAS